MTGENSHPTLPIKIGTYRILRVLGEGGMGPVYEAEQDNPRRTVALKVLRPGLISPSLLRRFEQESQVLGRLQHPGIGQIYDAGIEHRGHGQYRSFGPNIHMVYIDDVERQKGESWGKSIVERLARDLQEEFPGVKWFSTQNLWYMRKLYLTYFRNEKLQPLVGELG